MTDENIGPPPTAEEVLAPVIEKWLASRYEREAPEIVPRNPAKLVDWWQGFIEPPEPWEAPKKEKRRDGKSEYWKTQYIDRLHETLQVFLSLPRSFQDLIVAARGDKVYWRGDTNMELFATIWDETLRMREMGVEAYRQECVSKIRRLKLGMRDDGGGK